MSQPQQKTVLITGANRGIGFAIAKTLLQQGGFQLLLAARHQKDAEEAVALLGAGIAIRLDLTDPLLLEQKALVSTELICESHRIGYSIPVSEVS